MRYILLLVLLLVGCAVGRPVRRPYLSSVEITSTEGFKHREIDYELHASITFTVGERAVLREAADKWRRVSAGHIRIELSFDYTEGSIFHALMKHNTVKSLSSWDRLVWETDVELQHRIPGGTTEALVTDLEDGSRTVVFVRDRLLPKNLEVIATHEFGHVIGLPDLPTMGDVMSAVHTRGEVVSTINLTPADIELCRGFGYCD